MTVDPYTDTFFTLRYSVCKDTITGWGFAGALAEVYGTGKMLTAADYPYFEAVRAELIARAELAYQYREIGGETPDQWTYLCSVKWAELITKYNDVLAMEAGVTVTSPDIASQTIDYGHTVENIIQDTPYGQLNSSSDYVSQKSKLIHDNSDTITNREELDSEILSKFRDRWTPTIQKMVDELGELFIAIVGGDFVI